MTGLASSYNFTNTLNSLNRDHALADYVIDLFFQSMKALNYLRQKGQYDDVTGGTALTWPVNTQASPNTVWYIGDQNLPITSMASNIWTAALDWKFLDDALVSTLTDILINDGSPDAIANQVAANLDITKMSALQALASAWLNNTIAINPLAVDGAAEAVDDGTVQSTYAGIAKAVPPNGLGTMWQGVVNYGSAGTNPIPAMFAANIQTQIDNSRPDFFVSNRLIFSMIWAQLSQLDRYIMPDLARTFGATDLAFNGNPMFIDNNMPTGVPSPQSGVTGNGGTILGLNSRYVKLITHPNANFDIEEWQKAQGNNTFFTRIHWAGNVVFLNPQTCWQVWQSGG